MAETVKPCPFCGGPPTLQDCDSVPPMAYRCDCIDIGYLTEAAAREAWNRRATGQTEREATEPSEAMVEDIDKKFHGEWGRALPKSLRLKLIAGILRASPTTQEGK